MSRVLVIDDEAGIRSALKDILEDERYAVVCAEDGILGLEAMTSQPFDIVLLDLWLPRMGGIDVLAEIKRLYPQVEVIVISGHGSIDMAVRAVKLGAFDFIEKPLSIERVLTAARNARRIGELREENRSLKRAVGPLPEDRIIGSSAAMEAVRVLISQSAQSDARVLVSGENGTGKELVARAIHRESARSPFPFVEVNCAAIPDTLIESELFGHEKGAFTDAVARRRGKFEAADGGTIFLDEIGDMSPSAQAKVLRAIQELRFERLGSEETIGVDVRVIAATNKDLREAISAGTFREDLFFRLNVIPIKVPALRERLEDLPELSMVFLAERPGQEGRAFSAEGLSVMAGYPWPGNVRELKNFVERVSVMSDETEISADTVAHFLASVSPRRQKAKEGVGPEYTGLKLQDARDLFERRYIAERLAERGGNIAKTAEAIGIYPSGLHAKIKKLGIEVER